MNDFATENFPPRLTPEPDSESGSQQASCDPEIRPSPPLRKSIYPHPLRPLAWHVNVVPYSPQWPQEFESIGAHLHDVFTTTSPPSPYLTIEHIGSTAVPGLAAKPNIDVLVTFATTQDLEKAVEALNWEIPKAPPFAKYTQIPRGGGIPGRESYKIYLFEDSPYYATTPERSVYLIADIGENVAGRVQIRCYRTLRDVLRMEENADLLAEYAQTKLRLSEEAFVDGIEYSARKDEVVRKILLRGGWSDVEIDEKERLTRRDWVVHDEEVY